MVGRTLVGKFTITELLGKGGFGAVYRALQHPVEREVAIKVLRPLHASSEEQVKRFFQEARSIGRLRNQHTIQLYDFGQADDGSLYMAMELAPGVSLSTLVRRLGRLAPRRAAHILAQVCESLADAHLHEIIHRDLKPENIMLEDRPDCADFVKVLDFGIAKLRDPDGVGSLTASGIIQGTPSYMSPEQVQARPLTPASDLYALGVVLFQCLTGRVPFRRATPLATALAHVQDPRPDVRAERPDVPVELARLVSALLSVRPGRRPASASVLREQLLGFLGLATPPGLLPGPADAVRQGATPGADPVAAAAERTPAPGREEGTIVQAPTPAQTTAFQERKRSGRRAWGLAAGGAVAVALLVVLWVSMRPGPGDTQGVRGPAPGWKPPPVRPLGQDDDSLETEAEQAAVRAGSGGGRPGGESVESPTAARGAGSRAGVASEPDTSEQVVPAFRGIPGRTRGVAARRERRAVVPWGEVAPWKVSLTVDSEPGEASVRLGGKALGTTPLSRLVPYSSKPVGLVVFRAGYQPEGRTVVLTEDRRVEVQLGRRATRPAGGDLPMRLGQ